MSLNDMFQGQGQILKLKLLIEKDDHYMICGTTYSPKYHEFT